MKTLVLVGFTCLSFTVSSFAQNSSYKNDDFAIQDVKVISNVDLGLTVWEINVAGLAGKTTPTPVGKMDGAPVLAYVFPTSLKTTDVGFNATGGIVALALTSHPDFDDTPLWDENSDKLYDNDGIVWHPHWVILVEDKRVVGGLAVKQFEKDDTSVVLPPTNPGMPMYMDSPGYNVMAVGKVIRVVVPNYRINNQTDFSYDGVAALMRVNTGKANLPMLGVYEVYSVASGDLSLPYKVKK